MKKNFKVDKTVLSYIYAKNFWQEGDADKFKTVISNLKFVPKQYGHEIDDFNMTDPELDMVFSEMLGDWIEMKEKQSGIFRIPYSGIHFEDFNSLNEWRFIVALEDNQFTIFNHKSGVQDARKGYNFDYKNSLEWTIDSIVSIKKNDCLFYRPWVFHSLEPKPVYYYKLMVIEED